MDNCIQDNERITFLCEILVIATFSKSLSLQNVVHLISNKKEEFYFPIVHANVVHTLFCAVARIKKIKRHKKKLVNLK